MSGEKDVLPVSVYTSEGTVVKKMGVSLLGLPLRNRQHSSIFNSAIYRGGQILYLQKNTINGDITPHILRKRQVPAPMPAFLGV